MSNTPSKYFVLLFASLKDAADTDRIGVELENNATVQQLLDACAQQYPAIAPWLSHLRVAVNCEYVQNDATIKPEDEIALLPPVAGGIDV